MISTLAHAGHQHPSSTDLLMILPGIVLMAVLVVICGMAVYGALKNRKAKHESSKP